ncbi:MAG TPA: 3-hydroxybutyrate dehydrogenase [Acetobacteraceae bacterium]|nr:3-hydroxybutyrate dehydrogenase [Acetobacteraceae bacterium]
MSLSGRVALVTGSTRGIGLGIAEALAAAGADIVMGGQGDPAEIEQARAGLAARRGVRVLFDGADMREPEAVAGMVARAEREFGAVDILVNNAGIQTTAPIEAFPPERWDAIIAINLSAVFHAIRAAIPGMRTRGWGRIINIASAHGLVASAQKVAYVAAKHGVLGVTKVAAIELAGAGVTVNAICPGWVRTPLVEAQLAERAERHGQPVEHVEHGFLAEKQPLIAFTTPEQIGALAAFLCSDAAATMTGGAIPIDGGWTAW